MPVPYTQLKIRRGNKVDLPTLVDGELGYCEDTKELFIGSVAGNVKLNDYYNPLTPSNWSGTAPATIHEALDRLVQALATLSGGPI